MNTLADYPPWDGVEDIDLFKARRERELKLARTQSLPMMAARRDDGTPLYRMTSGGSWSRTAPLSRSLRRAVAERDRACVACGNPGPFEVDHIIRYVDGGSNEMDNLRALCVPCHRSRGGRA